jgi:Ca2+-binding EF-hand superfamily protein
MFGGGDDDKETFPAERKKIKAAFDLFDRDKKDLVVKEEIGTIMRYLGAYPTEEELATDILPQIQDDEETNFVKYDRFEPFMVRVMVERNFEPDSEEVILQAFKVLDPDNKGYVDEDTIVELLTENEWAFREKEIEDFLRVAKDPDTGYIHFEDYVSLLAQ